MPPDPSTVTPDQELCPAALVEEAVKRTITAARPAARRPMWASWQGARVRAAESSPGWLPWMDPREVTEVTKAGAVRALETTLAAVPDDSERSRLREVLAGALDELEAEQDAGPVIRGVAGKLPPRRCQHCGSRYYPARSDQKFCPHPATCRQAAHKEARRLARGG